MSYPGYPGGSVGYQPPPPSGDVLQLRMRQIETLRQYIPTTREIDRGNIYEVPLTLPGRTVALRIALPPTFPSTAPYITLVPPMRHAFVHPATGQVVPQAHEHLRSWGLHCILGKTVNEIAAKLASDPPGDMSYPPPPPPAGGPHQVYPSGGTSYLPPPQQPPPPVAQPPPPPPVAQPPPSRVDPASVPLPELESKTVEELEALLTDEHKFEEMFGEIQAVKDSTRVRNELRDSAAKSAKQNQEDMERIEALQREVNAKRDEVAAARAKFEEKARRRKEIEQETSPLALMKKLADAAKVADEESDAIAQRFLAGEIPPAEFVKQYREKRVIFHTRSAKRESLATATATM